MRFNSTQKRFLLFILGIIALSALVYYLAFIVPGIGQYVYVAVLGIVCVFVLYVTVMPLLSFLSERAETILHVYLDESGKGIHIFSAYSVSRYKIFRPPVRYIQHYFIITATGKLFYKILFSHEQQPVAGESGYTGYASFEISVLHSESLRLSMESFSQKAKMKLGLGKQIGQSDKDHYTIHQGDHIIEIKKFKGGFDDVFKVTCCLTDSKNMLWRRKI